MHKAVTARLQNPGISLFDALKIGGFEYASNNDSSLMDSEKVTLGQRKNQLSRRLRLARKSNSTDGGDHDVKDDDSGDATEHSLLQNEGTSVGGGSDGGTEFPSSKVGARALQMKRELDFVIGDGDMKTTTATSAAAAAARGGAFGSSTGTDTPSTITVASHHLEQASKRPRAAKFHPDYAPLIVPPASFRNGSFDNTHRRVNNKEAGSGLENGAQNQGPTLTSATSPSAYSSSLTGLTGSVPSYGLSYGSIGGTSTSYGLPNINASNLIAISQPRASAVAVSSLTSSAQAVGLTLEQLALSLSSNTTALAKLVSDTRSGQSIVQQLDLALNLYSSEVKALYTRCMLQAGIDPALAQPDTPTYLDFASKAWQKEGQRLEEIIGKARVDNGASGLSDLDQAAIAGANAASPKTKTSRGSGATKVSLDTTADTGGDSKPAASNTTAVTTEDDTTSLSMIAHNEETKLNKGHDSTVCDANHVHQLGQCGHRAIIHHPPEGSPHIDFIVGDHVECYSGINSVPLGRNLDSIWPSQFKCKDVDESDGCATKVCARTIAGPILDGYWSAGDSVQGANEPKILKLADVNLQDPEWNYDSDGGVLGLFKLGENDAIDNGEAAATADI
jgi:hypothetical protein